MGWKRSFGRSTHSKDRAATRGKEAKCTWCDMRTTSSSRAAHKRCLKKEVKPLVIGFLQERGLELSQEKTKITHIADGFDFLGQNIRKYNGLLLTRPSK